MRVANPCLKCGACCGAFRVSFYWSESDSDQGGSVPAEMTESLPPYLVCMRGTNQPHPRCTALRGRIGDLVSCSIYTLRSSTCRDFGFHNNDGPLSICANDLERCNHARELNGLPPLGLDTIIHHVYAGSQSVKHSHHHRPPLF
jgi:Fe-S-cluster containining protein